VPALRSLAALLVIVTAVAVVVQSGVFDDVSVDVLRARIESYGALAPLVFMGILVAGLVVPGPELLIIGIGGAIFGALQAFVYGWIAAVVGTTLTFFLVRQTVGAYVHGSPALRFRRLRAIDERVARRGFVTVFVLRVIFCMAPPLTWALGATRVRWRDYLGGTALGITPGIGLGAYLGDAVTDATSWNALLAPHVVVPTLLAVAFAMTGAVVGRRVFGGGGAR
jgi:uncharacterized membrane protein YdjX (TVP38/TMEM64 family)